MSRESLCRRMSTAFVVAWLSIQNISINGIHQAISGVAPRVAVVTVYRAGTRIAADIYYDDHGTPLPNPFISAWDGKYRFYANPGRYDVFFSVVPK